MTSPLPRLAVLSTLSLGLATTLWAAACSDQYADPIVAPDSGTGGTFNGFRPTFGQAGAADFPDDPDGGWGTNPYATLCQSCSSNADCGGRDDLCLFVHDEGRCGKACFSERDCPRDYDCVAVPIGPGTTWQCVPDNTSCSDLVPSLDELRAYLFGVVNDTRERRGLEPLQGDDCLEGLGQEAVGELETEGTFKTKFNRECADVIPKCECNWREESQAFVSMTSRTWQEAAQYPFDRAAEFDPNGNFFRNVVSSEWGQIGIGVLLDADYLRFSLEFAPPRPSP